MIEEENQAENSKASQQSPSNDKKNKSNSK